jgi:phosphomannomutase/phosphoglucomutase
MDAAPITGPRIAASGFREYDARWRFPEDLDLAGVRLLGAALGTQMHEAGLRPEIVLGHDYRAYAPAVAGALGAGLASAGVRVRAIGLALSPMAYFAQIHLDAPAVAMVTASHNPNGWTGVKMGFKAPLTHGPDEMARLAAIVTGGQAVARPGGCVERVAGIRAAWLEDLAGNWRTSRPLRAVCATGNGTAGAFAPDLLARIGVDVIGRHTGLDHRFPHYNPNPEALEMLDDMGKAVLATGADLALGFDGDGDRIGVVDDEGKALSADKLGLMLARDLAAHHPGSRFVVDVKSTGLFARDPVLEAAGASVEYWKTGHSHIKRRLHATGALAGFEKSGHVFFAPPVGRGYDCALSVAVALARLMDRNPGARLSDLARALPRSWITPTLSPACPDSEKYAVVGRLVARLEAHAAAGGRLGGRPIASILTVNGARVLLDNGGWGLVRASSNTPNLVVVCESLTSEKEMRAILADLDAMIRSEPAVGAYDQTI